MIQPTTMQQAQPVMMYQPMGYQAAPVAQYQPAPYYQAPAQNNAVKIDIINPQAGGTTPYSPYAMPQASAYAPYVPNAPYPTPYYAAPVQQQPVTVPQPVVVPQPIVNQPQIINAPHPVLPEPPKAQVVTQPAPQPVVQPAPQPVQPQQVVTVQPQVQQPEVKVIEQPKTEQAAPAVVEQAPAQAEAQVAEAPKTEEAAKAEDTPKVETPATPPVDIKLNEIVSKLNSTNMDTQFGAIENVAETAQSGKPEATQLLDTQVMDALGNIIKKDTTQMQGPTPEQLELRQKLLAKENLTDEQKAEATKISEMEVAERNKQFSLYTVAILQKLLNDEVKKVQGTGVKMEDLPMINDVVKVAKSDPNPILRGSALASLLHLATPEYKKELEIVFKQSLKDSDPNVQAVAQESLTQLSQI